MQVLQVGVYLAREQGEGVALEQRREAPSRSSTRTGRSTFPLHTFIPLPCAEMMERECEGTEAETTQKQDIMKYNTIK